MDQREDAGRGDRVGRSKIQGHVGSVGASGQVAIGENIQQVSTTGPPQLTPAERAELDSVMAQLQAAFQALNLDERTRILGEERVGELQSELTKKDEVPDASVIKVAGDWLLDHIPPLAGAITSVFASPVVGILVKAAGDVATGWIRDRFGRDL